MLFLYKIGVVYYAKFKIWKRYAYSSATLEQFMNEFTAWIKSRQSMGKEYTYFLDYMGLRFADADCVEIGKGKYDSVVKPFNTTIITPATPIKKVNPDRIIKGNMRVYESVPMLVRHNDGRNQLEPIPSDIIQTYMTQNPFGPSSILGWENLHNSGEHNIILGIYGSIYDKDIKTRIKQLETLRDKLIYGDYKEDYSTHPMIVISMLLVVIEW